MSTPSPSLSSQSIYGVVPLADLDLAQWLDTIDVSAGEIANAASGGLLFTYLDVENGHQKQAAVTLHENTIRSWKTTRVIPNRGKRIQVLTLLTALIKLALVKKSSILTGELDQIREQAEAFVVSKAVKDQTNPLTDTEWREIANYIRPIWEQHHIPSTVSAEKPKKVLTEAIPAALATASAPDGREVVQSGKLTSDKLTMSVSVSMPPRVRGWAIGIVFVIIVIIISFIIIRSSTPASSSATATPLLNATAIGQNLRWSEKQQTMGNLLMDYVPAGCFAMGNQYGKDNVKPVTQFCFGKGFWIGKTLVTIGQFGLPPDPACNTDHVTPVDSQTGKPNYLTGPALDDPMNCITWDEANTYCQKAGLRLPTEAEWEYAARGPDDWLYPWGNSYDPTRVVMRLGVKMPGKIQPVGSFPNNSSWVGALDMIGPLREFTSTIYDDKNGKIIYAYPYQATDGREALDNSGNFHDKTSTTRVIRGGSFDDLQGTRDTTFRDNEWYDFRFNIYGFRCAANDPSMPPAATISPSH